MKIDKYRIFKNAVIGDEKNKIGKGLVVIGGLNRSGKSTFMEILSNLAWGFSKKKTNGGSERYRISCKIESADNGNEYEVILSDDTKPVIRETEKDSGNLSSEELYSIDKFAYQNLFCLDLNSLQKTDTDMDGKKREKLRALLLGAGLSDYIQIPALIGEFRKNAVGIAGELNKHDVKTLGKYYESLRSGIKLRERAIGQMDSYLDKKKELGSIENEIEKVCSAMKDLKDDTEKFGAIEKDFEEYTELLGDIEALNEKIKEQSRRADIENVHKLLAEHEKYIRKFKDETSGFRARIEEGKKKKNDLAEEKSRIIILIKKVNSNWDSDKWDGIKNIITDETTEAAFNEKVKKFEVIERDIYDLTSRNQSIDKQMDSVKIHVDRYKSETKSKMLMNLIITIAILLPVAFLLTQFVDPLLGKITAAIPLVLAFVALLILLDKKRYGELIIKDERLLADLQAEYDSIKTELEKFEKEKIISETEMARLKKLMELPEFATLDMMRKRFESIKNIKGKIIDYENLEIKTREHDDLIEKDLDNYREVFYKLNGADYEKKDMQWIEIANEGEKWLGCLELSGELDRIESKKNRLNRKLAEEMNVLPENITALEDALSVYRNFAEGLLKKHMLSDNQGTGIMAQLKQGLTLLDTKYNELKEERLDCKRDIENLAATEKLEDAQRQIDRARSEMQKAAEEHAVNFAAKTILEEIQRGFLEKTKHEILSKAARLFERITNGEYKEIMPPENLEDNDFQAELSSGEIQETVDILSRGTAEQLFLAVRLSRITDYEQKLPVIIDDSLANFDNLHTDQTIRILSELSAANQTFILTCHPELILQISKNNKEAQYWELEKGKFKLSDSSKLYEYLSGNSSKLN